MPIQSFVFVVNVFLNLTIIGPANLSRSSSGACAPPTPLPAFEPVLQILNSDRVVLRNLSISGGSGLFISDSAVVSGGDMTVSESSNNGIALGGVVGSRGTSLTLTASDVVQNSCANGVFVPPFSTLLSAANIHHNGAWGISGAGFITITGGSIHDNGIGGVTVSGPGKALVVSFGSITISSNGGNPLARDPTFRAGVSGVAGGIVQVVGDVTISGNIGGPGILLRLNSTGFFGDMNVTGNAGGGVKLQYASVADFTSFQGVAELHDNLDATIGDLHCDDYSNAFGDVSGAVQNNCPKEAIVKIKAAKAK
jgi:hypothetical protein